MIDYSPFWKTLEQSSENWYTLTSKHHLSHSTLHRLKHNKDVSTKTLNDLCRILNCNVQDIITYMPSPDDQTLWLELVCMSTSICYFLKIFSGSTFFYPPYRITPVILVVPSASSKIQQFYTNRQNPLLPLAILAFFS